MIKGLDNKELMMFMIIVNSPMETYNGRYSDLEFFSIFKKEESKVVLESMKEKGLIFYHVDPSDEDHFAAGIPVDIEVDYAVEIGIIKRCVDAKARYEYDNRIWD